MEHFPDPADALRQMERLLKPTGRILITFGEPWLSPWGSHMQFFCKVPWLNLWFSERTIMTVRSLYRQDGATRYEDVESGLNKMTLQKFERIVRDSGLVMEHRRYRCLKGLDFLARTPLRELFVNQINCVLAPAEPTSARSVPAEAVPA
jgi:SAM-dependent methyltransferase